MFYKSLQKFLKFPTRIKARSIIIIIIIIIIVKKIVVIIIIINDNVYGAVLMAMVNAGVHPVHLMNAD